MTDLFGVLDQHRDGVGGVTALDHAAAQCQIHAGSIGSGPVDPLADGQHALGRADRREMLRDGLVHADRLGRVPQLEQEVAALDIEG